MIVLVGTSCLKDTASTDLSHEESILEVIYPPAAQYNGVGSGLEYFGGGALRLRGRARVDRHAEIRFDRQLAAARAGRGDEVSRAPGLLPR